MFLHNGDFYSPKNKEGMKKPQFSFTKDGPLVTQLYCNDNMSVSAIAKHLGRGYNTIKNYLQQKNLYTGPATGKICKAPGTKIVPNKHIKGQKYFCLSHNTIAIFKHYYNDTCLVWLPNPDYLYYAYCTKINLVHQGELKNGICL